VSEDPEAVVTGQYFRYQKRHRVNPAARRIEMQEELLSYCAGLSGVQLPAQS